VAASLYKSNEVFAVYYRPGHNKAEAVPPHPGPFTCQFQDGYVTLFKPIQYKGDTVGAIYLKSDLQERRERLELCAALIGLLIVVSSVVTFFLSSRLQRIITKPIFRLVQTARAVSTEKNYSVRARKHADDELGVLIDGFNEMLSQ